MYKFEISHRELDERGVLRLQNYNSDTILKNIDFGEAVSNKEIEYRADGVYLKFGKKWLRGFYYMKAYRSKEFGLPRFHLFNCETMRKKHLFHGTYHWANSDEIDFYCRNKESWQEDIILPLCGHCEKMIDEKISNTLDFYSSNEKEKINITDFVSNIIPNESTNIFGYPLNWRSIASEFKQKNKLICNSCGIKERNKSLGYYFDVDHIDGFNKGKIKNNLQLLCKLCHTYKDDYHLTQALTYPSRNISLHEFVDSYKGKINRCNKQKYQQYKNDFKKYL